MRGAYVGSAIELKPPCALFKAMNPRRRWIAPEASRTGSRAISIPSALKSVIGSHVVPMSFMSGPGFRDASPLEPNSVLLFPGSQSGAMLLYVDRLRFLNSKCW